MLKKYNLIGTKIIFWAFFYNVFASFPLWSKSLYRKFSGGSKDTNGLLKNISHKNLLTSSYKNEALYVSQGYIKDNNIDEAKNELVARIKKYYY